MPGVGSGRLESCEPVPDPNPVDTAVSFPAVSFYGGTKVSPPRCPRHPSVSLSRHGSEAAYAFLLYNAG
jgi:hypothetical protein